MNEQIALLAQAKRDTYPMSIDASPQAHGESQWYMDIPWPKAKAYMAHSAGLAEKLEALTIEESLHIHSVTSWYQGRPDAQEPWKNFKHLIIRLHADDETGLDGLIIDIYDLSDRRNLNHGVSVFFDSFARSPVPDTKVFRGVDRVNHAVDYIHDSCRDYRSISALDPTPTPPGRILAFLPPPDNSQK